MIRNFVSKNKYPLILVVLTLIFFWKIISSPHSILYSPFSDMVTQEFFWKYLIHDTFQKFHELPLWNPYTFSGMPFLASHFSKMFYPPNMLFLFFASVELVFNYLYIMHFFLAGLFIYLFAKEIGLNEFSSFIAAIIYIFNIRIVTLVYTGLTNELPLIVFFPATLYLFERLAKKRNAINAILMGVSLALIILGVHTQYIAYSYIFLFVYFIFRIKIYKKSYGEVIKFFIFSIILSILLSSVQLLPSIEILKYDTRSRGIDYEFATASSFPPYHLITAIIPNFFGTLVHDNYWSLYPFWQFAISVGIFPLILMLFSFKRKNHFVIFFAVILLLSLALAFGKYNPFYHLLYKFIPIFGKFRAPSRFLFFYIFSIAIMAGFGANFLISVKKSDKGFLKKALFLLCVLLVLCMLIFAGIFLFKAPILKIGNELLESKYSKNPLELKSLSYYKEKIGSSLVELQKGIFIFVIILSSITMLISLWIRDRISLSFLKFLITAIIITDLWLFSMPFVDVKSLDIVYTQRDMASFLSNDKNYFRVADLVNALPQEIAIRQNLEQTGGYEPMILADYREYISEIGGIPFVPSTVIGIKEIRFPKMLDLLNAKYIISDKKLKDGKDRRYELVYNNTVLVYTNNEKKIYSDKALNDKIFEFSGFKNNYVYKNKDAMPRAFVVGNYMLAGRNKILEILKGEEFKPKEYVILEENVYRNEANKMLKGTEFKEAEITFYSPNKIVLNADIKEPGFLVLSEVWYPGWRAFDNGKEIKIYRANYIFRSVYLREGKHKVKFIFNPVSYGIGLWISLVALSFIIVYASFLVSNKIKNFK